MKILLAPKTFKFPAIAPSGIIGSSLGHNLTLGHGKYLNIATKTLTEDLGPCVNLTMWAGKQKFVGHSAPELEHIDRDEGLNITIGRITDNLRGRLKNSLDEIHAFITGGIARDGKSEMSDKSFTLIEEMYEALSKLGIPTTVIAGQKSNGLKTRMQAFAYNDNIFIKGQPIDNITKTDLNLEDAIKNEFDFVELTKNTPIEIAK